MSSALQAIYCAMAHIDDMPPAPIAIWDIDHKILAAMDAVKHVTAKPEGFTALNGLPLYGVSLIGAPSWMMGFVQYNKGDIKLIVVGSPSQDDMKPWYVACKECVERSGVYVHPKPQRKWIQSDTSALRKLKPITPMIGGAS